MRVHDNAFLALIRADLQLSNAVFEGTVKSPPPRYVSVFARESRAVGRFMGPHSTLRNEYVVHSVATTPDQAKWVRERMMDRVLDATPDIAGWNCRRVQFVTSRPIAVDDDITPQLFYTVDVLAFEAERL